ncbi:MAG: GAF domain-containing protein, partial [Chlorobi bacterium]|nr:GAF domain-containing protein [Chlorobiota bacterium]
PLLAFFIALYFLLFPQIKVYTDDATQTISTKTADYYALLLKNKFASDFEMLKSLKVSVEKYKCDEKEDKAFYKSLLKHQINNKKDILSSWLLKEDGTNKYFMKYTQKENELKFEDKVLKSGDFYSEIFRSLKSHTDETNLYVKKISKIRNDKKIIFSIVTPFFYLDEISGVIGFDFSIKNIAQSIKKEAKFNKTDLMLLYNNELFDLNSLALEDDIKKSDIEDFILSYDKKNKKTFFYTSENNKKYAIVIKPINVKTNIDNISLVSIEEATISKGIFKNLNYRFFILLLVILISLFFIISYLIKSFQKRLNETKSVLKAMAKGDVPDIKELEVYSDDEISTINKYINDINYNLDKTSGFIEAIGKGDFDYDYKSLSENDKIGNSLIELKKNLEQAKELELKRKEEDERQTWATIGTAKFSEIIREHSDNLEDLSYAIISDLVNYIGANQGGLFVINEDENNEKYIELLASYAFSRRKMLTKKIPWGVGLVGRCILEKETIFMTKIPEKYLSISSGLGEETPASLLIVPLIFHEEVFGVVELASFSEIEQYKIDLVEHISESIASAISMVKINVRTAELLRESKIKSEQTASQEEEIRQNIEEMQAATDELNAKLEDANSVFKALNSVANIAQFDLNGRIIDVSDNFLKLLQKEKKDLIGKVQGSFSEEAKDPTSFKNFWDELKKGKQMEFEQVVKVNGELIRLHSVYIPIKNSDGEVYKVISFANKIS